MIRVGTSGWHYPSGEGTWNGPFYPKPRPRGFDELRFYADRFDTVEVNATFYRQPEAGMSRKWLDRTPESFLFSLKLFQKFTHPEMFLKRAERVRRGLSEGTAGDWDVNLGDIDAFRMGLEPIASAGRLGALLIQFPSSFHNEPATQEYLRWLMDAFREYPRAVELRHASWKDAGAALVEAAGGSLVLQDEPFAEFRGSRVPRSQGSLTYIRLHGRNKANWWEHKQAEDRYNYLYSAEELEPIADFVTEEAALEKRVLVYFNNHFSAKAVANADILKNQLGQIAPTWELRP